MSMTDWSDPVADAFEAGFSVVPGNIDKQPKVKWRKWQTEHMTEEEFKRLGHGSVWGVVTGSLYGITVLDFDFEAGGEETLRQLGLTPHVRTPGGAHVYVRHPGHPVKNSARKFPDLPGLDTRGDGGLAWFYGRSKKGVYEPIVWPPQPVDLDPELADRLFPHPQNQAQRAPRKVWSGEGLGEPEALRYLTYMAEQVRRALPGTSNAALNKAAYSVGGLVAAGQLDHDHAYTVLMSAAEMRGAGDPEAVIKSAMTSGAEAPWRIDPPGEDGFIPIAAYTMFKDAGVPEPSPFPVDALPDDLAEFVTIGAKAVSAPVDYFGAGILPVLGLAIGGYVELEITQSWHESPLLYVALVGPPSWRKSPALRLVMSPVLEAQSAAFRAYQAAVDSGIEDPDGDDFQELDLPRLVVDDITIEKLFDVLERNPRGVILRSDELTGWVKGFGQYKNGLGRDRQHWLSIWGRDAIYADRKKSTSNMVERPFVAVLGGIQPEPLDDLIHGKDDGLLPRILMAHGEAVTPRLDRTIQTNPSLDKYRRLWNRLRDQGMVERVVQFTPSGYGAFETWVNEHHYKTLREVQPELAGAWGKMDAQAARIALILSMALGETEVSGDAVDRAIAIVRYFQGQAALLLTDASTSSSYDKQVKARQKQIVRFLSEHPNATKADIMAMGPAWAANPRTLDPLLDALRELGVWRG